MDQADYTQETSDVNTELVSTEPLSDTLQPTQPQGCPEAEAVQDTQDADTAISSRVFTVANIVSIIRLCLIPVFMVLLKDGHNYLATFVFALAAGTDFIDGYIARSTKTISKLGRILDPLVDRLLMVFGVIGLFMVGRLPFWIIAVVLIRDIVLLFGGFYFMTRYHVRPKVIFLGKVVTTLLFIGFGGLLLNTPIIDGLNIVSFPWLPGLNSEPFSWGIWFVYAGLVLGLITTIYYVVTTLMKVGAVKAQRGMLTTDSTDLVASSDDGGNTE